MRVARGRGPSWCTLIRSLCLPHFCFLSCTPTLQRHISSFNFKHFSHVVGVRPDLPPLDQGDLRHDEGGKEDEDHLGVHRLMATVLVVHLDVLQSEIKRSRFIAVSFIFSKLTVCLIMIGPLSLAVRYTIVQPTIIRFSVSLATRLILTMYCHGCSKIMINMSACCRPIKVSCIKTCI